MNQAWEVNFDGIVGPTHNYGGLAWGNIPARRNRGRRSFPRRAAQEGLKKMRLLMELGIPQAVLPPHERPYLPLLRALGYEGSDQRVLEKVWRGDPELLSHCSSAAAMWAANAATVSPSADTADRRVHFTPANLVSQLHRSIEAPVTTRLLRRIFNDADCFVVHDPVPAAIGLRDEGAANHLRLAPLHGRRGLEIFFFDSGEPFVQQPWLHRFPARQSLGASLAVQLRHKTNTRCVVAIGRDPRSIDAGAFHNDLVAMSNQSLLIYHREAYEPRAMNNIVRLYRRLTGEAPRLVEIGPEQLSLTDALRTYFFNSQLVTLPDGRFALIAPMECRRHAAARRLIEDLTAGGVWNVVHFTDVRQSMRNGGGPACLRLRAVLDARQLAAMHQGVLLSPRLYRRLVQWVERHYRAEIHPADMADPQLLRESRTALDELTRIIGLGSIYDFQR